MAKKKKSFGFEFFTKGGKRIGKFTDGLTGEEIILPAEEMIARMKVMFQRIQKLPRTYELDVLVKTKKKNLDKIMKAAEKLTGKKAGRVKKKSATRPVTKRKK